MNKNIFTISLLGLLILSCSLPQVSEKETNSSLNKKNEPEFIKTIEYSNLVDKASQEEVRETLNQAEISTEYINSFFDNVDEFNKTVGEVGLVKNGFKISEQLTPKYNIANIQIQWEKKYSVFPGYNCRITSFEMMKDFIKITQPDVSNPQNLFVDEDALDTNPKKVFSEEERKNFLCLFSQVPTDNHKNVYQHFQKIKDDWRKKGISFAYKNDKNKASLVSVVFHSSFSPKENNLFIGHIGVLAPTKDKKLIFIEKLAFEEPYQAIKFNNRTELNDYLMNRYDIEWGQTNAKPFILENDEIIEGYRPNPKNVNN